MRTQNFIENSFIPYSFQGQEHDDEVKGEGNSVNYKYRMCDPRVGRFFAVDPLASKYPYNGPYNFSENRVIDCGELEGLEIFYAADGTKLGKIGTSNELRVVKANEVKKVQKAIAMSNSNLDLAQKEYKKIKNNQFSTVNKAYIKVKATLYWKAYEKNKDVAINSSTPVNISEEELNTRAMLYTIRNSEGHGNTTPYNRKFNGGVFTETTTPDIKGTINNSEYAEHPGTDPAGAYQIKEKTFDWKAGEANVSDFSPEAQDAIAIELINFRKAGEEVMSGNLEGAFDLLKNEWTSLPGAKEQGIDKTKAFETFKQGVSKELSNNSDIATPAGTLKLPKKN